MLYEFLNEHRATILAKTKMKTSGISQDKPVTTESQRGLPQFYDHLARELEREYKGLPAVAEALDGPNTTGRHDREMKRLGYTISQIVQEYAVLSQSIVEMAQSAAAPISAKEFKTLNLILDAAIAEAVSEFAKRAEGSDCAQKLGVLAHELRNALAAATLAHKMVKDGIVCVGGNTHDILERNLDRMRNILDRSFSEVRMQNEKEAGLCPVLLIDIAAEVEATAGEEARTRGLTLEVAVDAELRVLADPHYLISALSNLVQNAIKYSRKGGTIWVRSMTNHASVGLDVEDQCGGLPPGKAEELFQPFTQKSADRTGLGLGLTISRQAVAFSGGTLSVRDLPGKGCIFSIALPKEKSPS